MAAGARRQRDQAQRLPTLAAQFARQRMAIDATQADIDQCGSAGLAHLFGQGAGCILLRTYVCAPALQLRGKHVAIERMVLDQQQPHAGQRRAADGMSSTSSPLPAGPVGRRRMKRLPRPSTLCTVRSPPIARASSRAMERPRPVPPRWWPPLPCWNGWNSVATWVGSMPMPLSITSSSSSRGRGGRELQAQLDAADVTEFHRVGQQVAGDLAHGIGIQQDECRRGGRRIQMQRQALALRLRPDRLQRLPADLGNITGMRM